MKPLKVYHHPNCTSCKKAIKYLDQNGINYTLIDLRDKAPSKKDIQSMLKNYPDKQNKLFNSSGQVYRQNDYKNKLKDMDQKQKIDALANNGLLVKRPFALKENGQGLLGFKIEEWDAFIQQ